MSSNHKAPLAAFVVVAIACVVVLATNSMRSYAREAWRTFSAPVVDGISLIHSDHVAPSPSPTTSAAPVVEHAVVVAAAAPIAPEHGRHHRHASAQHVAKEPPLTPATPVETVVSLAPPASASAQLPHTGWDSGKHLGWAKAPHAPGHAGKAVAAAKKGKGKARGHAVDTSAKAAATRSAHTAVSQPKATKTKANNGQGHGRGSHAGAAAVGNASSNGHGNNAKAAGAHGRGKH